MKVYVIMGNDYPAAVFKTEAAAEKYVAERKAEKRESRAMIYWRAYEFELQE